MKKFNFRIESERSIEVAKKQNEVSYTLKG